MEQLWSSWSRLSKLRGNRTQRGKAVRCKDELSSAVWRLSYSERNNLPQTFLHNSYMNKLRSRAPLRLYCSFCVSNEFSAHYSGGQRWKRKDSFSYICRAVNKQVMSVFVCLHESCRSRRLSLSVWIIKLRSGLHQEEQNASRLWGSKPGIFRSLEDKVQLDMSRTLKKYTNTIRCSASPAGRLHDDVSSSQPGSSAAPTDDSARSQISSPVYICKLNMFQMLDYQPSYRGTCPEAPRLRSSRGPERFMLVNWFVLVWLIIEGIWTAAAAHLLTWPGACSTSWSWVASAKSKEHHSSSFVFYRRRRERQEQEGFRGARCSRFIHPCWASSAASCSGCRAKGFNMRTNVHNLRVFRFKTQEQFGEAQEKILILIYIHIIPRAFTDPEFSST